MTYTRLEQAARRAKLALFGAAVLILVAWGMAEMWSV